MPPIEQQILVRIRNLVEGLPQVQALSNAVSGLSKTNGNGLKSTAAQVVNLGAVSDKTLKNVSSLYNGFQNVSRGFADGTVNVQKFTAGLSGAAKEVKAITDQSRLLGPTTSIQLPARNPVFETLKPLTGSGDAEGVRATTNALHDEAAAVNRVKTNAETLAEAWLAGNAAAKKQVETIAAMNAETNAAFKNIISGNAGKSGFGQVAAEAKSAKQPIQAVAEEVETTKKSVGGASSAVSGLLRSLGRIVVISALFAAFYAIVNSIRDAISLVEEGIKSFITTGIKYNASLETSKVSLASLIASTSDIKDEHGNLVTGAEKFAAAERIAGQEMTKVQAIALATRYQFEDILQAITLATAAVGGTNVTLSQTVGLVEKMARAAAAVRLNPSQFQTQTRQILTGAARIQTTLATALFPGQNTTDINKQIKQWRDAGTLVDNLNKKLEVFSLTAAEVEGTFDALSSNVEDAFKKFAGQSTLPLFEKVKDILNFIIHQIVVFDDNGVRLTPTFQKLADILSQIGDAVGTRLLRDVKIVADEFGQWVSTLSLSPTALGQMGDDIVNIAENIAGMITDVIKLTASFFTLGGSVDQTGSSLHGIALLVATIRDGLKVIYGIIELIAGVFQSLIVIGITSLAEAILIITGRLDQMGHAADEAYKRIKRIFTLGVSDIVEGLNGVGQPGQRTGARVHAGLDTGDFNAFPRPNTGDGGKAASERQKRERVQVLRELNEAASALYLQNAKNEVDIANAANEELLKQDERRFNEGLIAAKDFYAEKEKLSLENVRREEEYKQKELEAEKDKLRSQLAAIDGQATITDSHFQDILDKFNASDRNNLNPKDVIFNKQIVEILKSQKSLKSIQAEINKLAQDRKNIQDETNNSTQDSVRINKQLSEDIKGQLADALGATGESEGINLTRRISDEIPKLLNEFGDGIPGLKEVAQVVHDLGDTSLDSLLKAFDTFNVDVSSLPEPLQNALKLFKQLTSANALTQSSGRVSQLSDKLKFDLEGIQTGFDQGDIGLTDAVNTQNQRKQEIIQQLNVELQKQRAILDSMPQPVTPEELASYDAVTQKVAGLSRVIDKLKTSEDALALISQASQIANDEYSATLDDIAIKKERFAISGNQADQLEIQAKELLIQKLQEELALAQQLDQAVPSNAQKVRELTNQIGQLQNEASKQTLDLAHGIQDSIGGAFQNFFDAITQGNQGILDSFRQAVAGMLVEIAKLIFQAYALKAIMSAINSFIGGFIPGGGGGKGGATIGAGGKVGGFAEGGIVSGPGTGISDSVPAMLSHGEGIIPARRVGQYGRGFISSLISGSFLPMRGFARMAEGGFAGDVARSSAASGGGHTRIVNIVDKSLVSDYLNSSEGEQIILNVIGKNRGMIQRLV